MQPQPKPAVKVFLSLIGLAAVLLPVILMATNFQPLAFLFNSPTPSQQTTNNSQPEATNSGTPLLTKADFEEVKKNGESLIIDLRPEAKEGKGVLKITSEELTNLINETEKGKLPEVFHSTRLVLVTRDLVSAYKINQTLKDQGFLVSVYLTDAKD